MTKRPTVVNFSGNDSAGLAGLAMDIRTQQAMGVHSASVITANTAQNHQTVLSTNPVDNKTFTNQLKAVEGLPCRAVKVGLIATPQQAFLIKKFVEEKSLTLLLDTVFASSSGKDFSSSELIEAIIQHLLPLATLVTPNTLEAARLTGSSITSTEAMQGAAEKILAMGAKAVLLKGGHFPRNDGQPVQDYFTDGRKSFWLASEFIETGYSRGTGCALASAIASAISLDYSLYDAIVIGKMAISQGLRHAYGLELETGQYNDTSGPVAVQKFPDKQQDLPVVSDKPVHDLNQGKFSHCQPPALGLYPVVNRANWIATLAPSGITTLQLRVKDLQGETLATEIKRAIDLANKHQVRLFINDHWKLAITYGAYGVHLGQEDLDTADIEQIHRAGLRLGISSHCHYEVARAHYYRPSYIACGPIFHTTTKIMPWVPQGIDGLKYWQKLLKYPVVAIGGINAQRFDSVAETGVDNIAMITAITEAADPQTQARDFVSRLQTYHDN